MDEIDCRICAKLTDTAPTVETAPGTTVWVVARDEENTAVEVAGYVFLACVVGAVIASPRISDYELAGMMEYHMEQTAEYEETSLAVFPLEDCYATKPDALAAFARETEG